MPPDDRRHFPCPDCGEGFVHIGRRCGFCGKVCTEHKVRQVEVARKKALLAVYHQQPELEGMT